MGSTRRNIKGTRPLKDNLEHIMAANSTVMFSGINQDSRNSSKVLRPPGGGSSDIFGLGDEQETQKTPSQENSPRDAVNEIEDTKEEDINVGKEESPAEEEAPQAMQESAQENNSHSETTTSEQNLQPTPTLSAPVAGVRGRIPPGGHSSGSFW